MRVLHITNRASFIPRSFEHTLFTQPTETSSVFFTRPKPVHTSTCDTSLTSKTPCILFTLSSHIHIFSTQLHCVHTSKFCSHNQTLSTSPTSVHASTQVQSLFRCPHIVYTFTCNYHTSTPHSNIHTLFMLPHAMHMTTICLSMQTLFVRQNTVYGFKKIQLIR